MARQAGDSELSPEQLNRLDHCIAEADKAWDDRFELLTPKFLERYLRGDCGIHLHIRQRTLESNAQEFCAVFGAPNGVTKPIFGGESLDFVVCHLTWPDMDRILNGHCTGNNVEESMFVGIGEAIEDGKRIVNRFEFPIRLRSLDCCARSFGDALYYSTVHGVFETFLLQTNRELVVVGGRPFILDNQGVNEMVEAGSQVVDNLTYGHGKCQCRLDTISPKNILPVVEMSLDAVAINNEILSKVGVELVDALFGPINLRPTPVEWM